MFIAGFQKNSFIDYPGKIAAVVFTGGCNYNCWYCHNRDILTPTESFDPDEVFAFLGKRKGMLDAVVISGGEPTLQPDLADFIGRVREMGYLIKLDTNGSDPGTVRKLLNEKQLDYIAMDIKAPFDKYRVAACVDADVAALRESLDLIMKSGIDYEFRTTCIPQLTPDDIEEIARQIKGAKTLALQQYQHKDTYSKILGIKLPSHDKQFFLDAKALAEKHVGTVLIRGLKI